MSRQKSYNIAEKNKKEMKIKGGYVSSLTGISQSERAELYKEQRRGSGIHENKKRKDKLNPKHKKSSYYGDSSCAFSFI